MQNNPTTKQTPGNTIAAPRKSERNEKKPVIGISVGDINGIGLEVILKALSDKRMLNMMTPVIFSAPDVVNFYRGHLKINLKFDLCHRPDQIHHGSINVVSCWKEKLMVSFGEVNETGGTSAFYSLQSATKALENKYIDAVVTAPINKNNIQREDFSFPGHTEYFTTQFEANDSLMFLVNDELRVGVVTGHIPLTSVGESITRERVTRKLNLMLNSLKQDFGIQKPKVAVLGLNPHAGEEGLLGAEEENIIKPVIEQVRKNGNLVYGPFPADGFFGMMHYRKFDGVLAMYHDQGLIPFKTIAFQTGVNYTAGLPVIRTSPDHGTAYDLAGKNGADETSMREALYLACDIVNARRQVT
jgi:4-phospho-D-threonate 3-dehydrogenase / 4-phospho-D-erythronate 3-dehydrogenase